MENTRELMANYWKHFKPTLSGMMLDTNAEAIASIEQQEILSYLSNYHNKEILELGSGIGRYTGIFAEKASKVLTVDFMTEFIEKNKEVNKQYSNIDYLQSDVTQLKLAPKSYDLVFTNWLFMYLNDEEVEKLISNILIWLKNDGYLFVRESCFHLSGAGVARPTLNPTFYRHPSFYLNLLQKTIINGSNSTHTTYFHLTKVTSLKTYIKYKNNPNQLCFLLKKMEVPKSTSDKYLSFQAFLDENQYTRKGILAYERIFGDSYISTGGRQTTEEFCATLNLKPGQSVLDVGCGIGGSAFYMAKHFGVSVHGVDLSSNMITIALERQTNFLSENKVSFEISDITQQEYEENSFNLIYSRDTILHIKNKELLFSRFKSWLKPGGKVLISDYCQGAQHHSDEFANYVQQRGYHLLTVQQYGRLLEAAGFEIVLAEDRTKQFIEILETEVNRFEKNKKDFIKDFDEEEYEAIVEGWKAKIRRCRAGDQCWGLFTATKASSS